MNAVKPPYYQYCDIDGSPLDGGYIYFGQPGQNPVTAPVPVYWDQAGTQPAAQPVRTINGFAARSGSPAQVYSATACSTLVKNARGEVVLSGQSINDLLESGMISHAADKLGAVTTTVHKKLNEMLSVKDFGAIGGGVIDDTAAFVQAAPYDDVFVPGGQYFVSSDVFGNFYSFSPVVIVGGGSVSITTLSTSIGRLQYFSAMMAAGSAVNGAAYGDSTTDGFATSGFTKNPTTDGVPSGTTDHNLTAPNAWPAKLQTLLREMFKNNNINIWNAGYSGKALADGWAFDNYEKAITQNPAYGVPRFCFIGFGLNDVRVEGSQIASYFRETRKLAAKMLSTGTLPVLLTCDPIVRNYDAENAILNNEVTRQLDAAKRSFAEQLNIPLIDIGAEIRGWLSNNEEGYRWFIEQSTDTNGDGIYSTGDDVGLHLKDNGHSIKAQIIAKTLYTDTVIYSGGRERLTAADARTNAFGNFLLTLSSESSGTDTHNAQGFNFRVNAYDPNPAHKPSGEGAPMLTAWIWNTNPEAELMYRGVYYEGWTRTKDDGVSVDHLPIPSNSSLGPRVSLTNQTTGTATSKVPAGVGFQNNTNYRFSDIPYRFGKLPYGLSKVSYLFGNYSHFDDGSYSLANYGYFELFSPTPFSRFNSNALKNTGEVHKSFTAVDTLFLLPEQKDGSNLFGMFYADAEFSSDAIDFYIDATIPVNSGVVLGWTKAWGGVTTGVNSVVATVVQRVSATQVRVYLVSRSGGGFFSKLFRTAAVVGPTFSGDRAQFKVRISRSAESQVIDVYPSFTGASVQTTTLSQVSAICHFGGAAGGIYWDSTAGIGSAAIHQLTIVR